MAPLWIFFPVPDLKTKSEAVASMNFNTKQNVLLTYLNHYLPLIKLALQPNLIEAKML